MNLQISECTVPYEFTVWSLESHNFSNTELPHAQTFHVSFLPFPVDSLFRENESGLELPCQLPTHLYPIGLIGAPKEKTEN